MAKLNTLIGNISKRALGDRRLAVLLGTIASGNVTTSQMSEFETIVRRLFYLAEFTGYTFQSNVVGRATSRDGLLELARKSVLRGSEISGAIESTLTKTPELAQTIREAVLGQATIYQGVTEGQTYSAEELNLPYKRWLHLGLGKESRPDHVALDGQTIPRTERFTLGDGSQVDSAHDWANAGARAWVNCSCQCVYLPRR